MKLMESPMSLSSVRLSRFPITIVLSINAGNIQNLQHSFNIHFYVHYLFLNVQETYTTILNVSVVKHIAYYILKKNNLHHSPFCNLKNVTTTCSLNPKFPHMAHFWRNLNPPTLPRLQRAIPKGKNYKRYKFP